LLLHAWFAAIQIENPVQLTETPKDINRTENLVQLTETPKDIKRTENPVQLTETPKDINRTEKTLGKNGKTNMVIYITHFNPGARIQTMNAE
jgi:hypothetical protein